MKNRWKRCVALLLAGLVSLSAGAGTQVFGAGQSGQGDTQSPEVNADIQEDTQINADIEEADTDIKANITPVDEQDDVVITEQDKPYLALGANLNAQQRDTVLGLMGIDPARLDDYEVVSVTNEEEHQYLDGYLDASVIGTREIGRAHV